MPVQLGRGCPPDDTLLVCPGLALEYSEYYGPLGLMSVGDEYNVFRGIDLATEIPPETVDNPVLVDE